MKSVFWTAEIQTCSNCREGNRCVLLQFTLLEHFGDLSIDIRVRDKVDNVLTYQIATLGDYKSTVRL